MEARRRKVEWMKERESAVYERRVKQLSSAATTTASIRRIFKSRAENQQHWLEKWDQIETAGGSEY